MKHKHDHTHSIAVSILKNIDQVMSFTPSHAKNLFIHGDVATTRSFWFLLEQKYPNVYGAVDYCPDFKKFTLYPKE
jgi:hypothetical protein